MNLNPNRLMKRLLSANVTHGKPASSFARRKRPTFESLECRALLTAMPGGGDPAAAVAAEACVAAEQRDVAVLPVATQPCVHASPLSAGDLADWQSNYGAGSAAPAGGGLDVLIANTGGDRAVDAALLDLASLSNGEGTCTAFDAQGRLLLGTEGGVWNRASLGDLASDTDPSRGEPISDDVIVDGNIITAENYDSAGSMPVTGNELSMSGQTVRLRIATTNNSGK